MNTKALMVSAAAVMGVAGIALSFLPEEIAGYLHLGTAPLLPLLLQVLGAVYLGFAILNWTAKANLIGGIYSRPVALGNFLHFAMAALALLKGLRTSQLSGAPWLVAGIYVVFAVLFGFVLFGHPIRKQGAAS